MSPSSSYNESVILAAGAIIERAGREVMLVHRRRYDDWTLPKGKVRPDETFAEAAIREVREETGCVGQLSEYLGAIGYKTEAGPKVVLFWRMLPSEQTSITDREEVLESKWTPLVEAIRQLSYHQEKDLLRRFAGINERAEGAVKSTRSRRIGWSWFRGERSYARLAWEFEAFCVELEFLQKRASSKDAAWADAAGEQLRNVRRYLDAKDIEGGWYCLHAAQRLALYGLRDTEIEDRGRILRRESQKISSWRSQAINSLLDDVKGELTADRLIEATALRDEYAANQYHKIWLMADQLGVLFWISLASLVTFLWAMHSVKPETTGRWEVPLLAAVLTVGILGASFSAAQSLIANTTKSTIPERVANHYVTIIRALFGATGGLAGYVFLQSEIIKVANLKGPGVGFATAFLFGYAGERLIAGIASSVKDKAER
jgi:8-oxo-dGTP pyrophosphatase MutT (NUDIX family)